MQIHQQVLQVIFNDLIFQLFICRYSFPVFSFIFVVYDGLRVHVDVESWLTSLRIVGLVYVVLCISKYSMQISFKINRVNLQIALKSNQYR